MFTTLVNAEGCAEIILSVAKERGFRIELFEPDVQRDVRFRITAPSKQSYRSARKEWGRRLTVSDRDGNLTGAAISKRKTRSRL